MESATTPNPSPEPSADHRPVFILVNNDRVGPFADHEVTGAQIKQKAGLALDGELSRITGHGLEIVKNDETLRIHENEKFRYIGPTPGS